MPSYPSDLSRHLSSKVAAAGNVVRITLPAEAYYNLERFQAIQKDILGKLGCLGCTSGWDLRYDIQRRFEVDEKLNVHAVTPVVEISEQLQNR